MALDKNLVNLLNEQINHELYSAYLYSTFCDFFESRGLKGFSNWYKIQTKEELDHASLFRQYLLDNDEVPHMLAIEEPNKTFDEVIEPLEAGYEHECYITGTINKLYAEAHKLHDFRTMQFLDWFIKEQQEEEVNATDLITDYKNFGASGEGLYALDAKYGARVYTPASILSE